MPGARVGVESTMSWTADGPGSALLLVRAAGAADQSVVDEDLSVVRGAGGGGTLPIPSARGRCGSTPTAGRCASATGRRSRWRARSACARATTRPCRRPRTWPSSCCPGSCRAGTRPPTRSRPPRRPRSARRPARGPSSPSVADWIRERVAYRPGASDALTTADETLLAREGVCRDMAHLGVSFLRALEIPARVVAAYAPFLEPPDFHALLEAHDGDGLADRGRDRPGPGGDAGPHRHRSRRRRGGVGVGQRRAPAGRRRGRGGRAPLLVPAGAIRAVADVAARPRGLRSGHVGHEEETC